MQWDYEGSGAQIVSAHGRFWTADNYAAPSTAYADFLAENRTRTDISPNDRVDLVRLREHFRLNQSHLASIARVSAQSISNLERKGFTAANRILAAYAALALCPRAVKRQIGGAA